MTKKRATVDDWDPGWSADVPAKEYKPTPEERAIENEKHRKHMEEIKKMMGPDANNERQRQLQAIEDRQKKLERLKKWNQKK